MGEVKHRAVIKIRRRIKSLYKTNKSKVLEESDAHIAPRKPFAPVMQASGAGVRRRMSILPGPIQGYIKCFESDCLPVVLAVVIFSSYDASSSSQNTFRCWDPRFAAEWVIDRIYEKWHLDIHAIVV
ncbi:hypothetical protein EAF00_011179 [Botryotinia globosa]|nr:hypothetical protein EAF00_011179 [Botryotinia globosa]